MADNGTSRGTLDLAEPHPAAYDALKWICRADVDLAMWLEAFSSSAIEGNRLAEVCAETLNRLMRGDPVSDRYLLGLVWTMRSMESDDGKD